MKKRLRFKYLILSIALFLLSITLIQSCNTAQEAPEQSRPNIIFILADDMGYSDIGCFGGEITTPNINALAEDGIRFTNFYNSSRCCPSRAALMTGQYPHQVGMGCMVDWPPNAEAGPYQGYMDHDQTTVANSLKAQGYSTYMLGKWHLGEEKEHWPLQYGFDKYFGLISGASSYFELIKNQKRIRKMAYDNQAWFPPEKDFYMTTAFSDTAVSFINRHDSEDPFFLYLAYTAPHWPLHALEKDITLFEEQYLLGWDSLANIRFQRMKEMQLIDEDLALPAKPESIPDWKELPEEEKKKQARLMTVYAAMIYRMDAGIGQLIQALKQKGLYENTVIFFASDNGATDANISGRKLNNPNVPLGSRGSYVAYREPWAWLSNVPYQKYKKSSYWGGMRTPMIVSYPKVTKGKNLISKQAGHFIDFLPTALQFANTSPTPPYQSEGKSLKELIASLDKVVLAERPLFLEHMGNKSIILGDWKLLQTTYATTWQLFNLEQDPLETNDLYVQEEEKAQQLIQLYQKWEARTLSYTLPNNFLE